MYKWVLPAGAVTWAALDVPFPLHWMVHSRLGLLIALLACPFLWPWWHSHDLPLAPSVCWQILQQKSLSRPVLHNHPVNLSLPLLSRHFWSHSWGTPNRPIAVYMVSYLLPQSTVTSLPETSLLLLLCLLCQTLSTTPPVAYFLSELGSCCFLLGLGRPSLKRQCVV